MTRAAAMLITLDRKRRDRRSRIVRAMRPMPSLVFVERFEGAGGVEARTVSVIAPIPGVPVS